MCFVKPLDDVVQQYDFHYIKEMRNICQRSVGRGGLQTDPLMIPVDNAILLVLVAMTRSYLNISKGRFSDVLNQLFGLYFNLVNF